VTGAKIRPRTSGHRRKALRASLCPEGFLFVHVVMNTFLRINRCFVGGLGLPTPKANSYHRGPMNSRSLLVVCSASALALLVALPVAVPADDSSRVREMTLGDGPNGFKIGLEPGTFPPFTSGEFKGIDFEVLKAVCEANTQMRCRVQLREFSECSVDGGVGEALARGEVDGCVNWVETAPRIVQGFEFAEPYHTATPPQLICVAAMDDASVCETAPEITPPDMNDNGLLNLNFATVGFVSGFFAASACLNDEYDANTYTVFRVNGENPILTEADLADRLNAGEIDYGFWTRPTSLPAGTTLAGVGVPSCGSESSLLLYPPSKGRKHKSDELRRAWNCGLALVRHTPALLADLLEALEAELGRPPLDPDEFLQDGPFPTVQCLEGNEPDDEDDDD